MIVLEDGDFLYFPRISKGTGYADAVYRHTETSTKFYKATINWNGNGWTGRLTDGEVIHFPESYSARNLAQGAAMEMLDSKGDRLELRRDGQRNLQEIRTPHGHWIKFDYDDASRIMRAEDDKGKWARYEYNTDGMLNKVTLSSGSERHYIYDKYLMTDITDENGRLMLHNSYRPPGILVRQQFGNGSAYSYDYDWLPDAYYSRSVTVTMPGGRSIKLEVGDSVPDYVRYYQRFH